MFDQAAEKIAAVHSAGVDVLIRQIMLSVVGLQDEPTELVETEEGPSLNPAVFPRRRGRRQQVQQFKRSRLAEQRRAVVIVLKNGFGVAVLGIGNEGRALLRLVLLGERGVFKATPVADGDRFKDIPVRIHVQGHGVRDTWIGRVAHLSWRWLVWINKRIAAYLEELALVLEVDGFPRMSEAHRVAVRPLRLQQLDGIVALGSGIRAVFFVRAIHGVNFLAQDRTFERAASLAHLVGRKGVRRPRALRVQECIGQDRVGKEHGLRTLQLFLTLLVGQLLIIFAGISLLIVLMLELFGDLCPLDECPGVKPGLGDYGRDVRRSIEIHSLRKGPRCGDCAQFLGIRLLDHTEAAELAFDSIKVPMVIGIARNEAIAADVVVNFLPLDDVHDIWQPRDP